MNLKAGDRVRFLDEKGEGVITRFIDNKQVLVEMEDGFEIPYQLAKLVPIAVETKGSNRLQIPRQEEEKTAEPVYISSNSDQALHSEGVFLVYQPFDTDFPLNGKFRILLFNMTPYHIHYTISTKRIQSYTCELASSLQPKQSARIREIGPEDIERWASVRVDVLYYSYEPFQPREPVSRTLKQKPSKFYKESSFSKSGLTDKPAIVVDLTQIMQKGQEEEYFEEKDLSKIVFDKEQKTEKRISRQSDKNNSALDWEVDLHLEELVDNMRGLNNGQMIDIQLRHFQKKLDEGFAANIRKIVFIHGVGNGRLKQEIRKILATHKELRFHDASYSTYGFGATEVVFR
jgi:hypothetical protein